MDSSLASTLPAFVAFLLGFASLPPATAAETAKSEAPKPALSNGPADPVGDLITFSSKYGHVTPLTAGANDGNVTTTTARTLKRFHYYRRGMDAEISERFLHRYFELLDPVHVHFVKTDITEFEKLRERLPEMTAKSGDSSPANEIFARFLQRIDERVRFVAEMLRTNQFTFTSEDRFTPNRKDADWPADLNAAHALWRDYVRYEYLQEKLNKQKPEQILKTLSARYKRLLRSWGELDNEEVLQLYLTALSQAYDPHSDYMGKAQLENFAISMKLSLFGIGALLRSDDGYCKIESLVPGGPAARSKKIKPNDRIVAVKQKDGDPVEVIDMKLTKVVEMIRGNKGSEVTLTIMPADAADPSERKEVTLVRDEIKLEDQEAKAKIIDQPTTDGKTVRLGVIDLPSFYATFDLGGSKRIQLAGSDKRPEPKSTTTDVLRLLKKLQAEGVQGVVLDLRRNGGGSLEEAIRLTGLFIKDGPVVQIKDANGDISIESDPDPEVQYDGPLIVLTSRFSASASEILAAALQDYGRALVVGDNSTHGKGSVQTIYELNKLAPRDFRDYNAGALKVTIRKFYRANGWSTQLKGVTPDIVLPSVANLLEVGESSQEFAMPWDTIPSAMFEKVDRIQPQLDELRHRTEARQAKDPEYAYVREDMEFYKKLQADKSVSLNESARIKEKDELENRSKKRKEERKARGESQVKTYEIALKNVDEKGLPAPVTATNEVAKATAPAAAKTDSAEEGEEEDEKTPVVDVNMEEARRILADLISLLAGVPKTTPVAATSAR